MNEDDARAKLGTFGVTEDDPEFATIFKLMTTLYKRCTLYKVHFINDVMYIHFGLKFSIL